MFGRCRMMFPLRGLRWVNLSVLCPLVRRSLLLRVPLMVTCRLIRTTLRIVMLRLIRILLLLTLVRRLNPRALASRRFLIASALMFHLIRVIRVPLSLLSPSVRFLFNSLKGDRATPVGPTRENAEAQDRCRPRGERG